MPQEEFSELFPSKEIKYNDKIIAVVRPIPLEDMEKVLPIVTNLILKIQEGITPEQLPFHTMRDMMKLIPYCVESKVGKLPGVILPEVINAMIELNLTRTVVKNWSTLLKTVSEKLPEILEKGSTEQGFGKE